MLLRTVCARGLRAPAGPRPRARSSAAAPAAAEEWEQARPFHEIPGPEPLPLVGNMWRFLPSIGQFGANRDLLSALRSMRDRYGDMVRVCTYVPGRDAVFLFDPNLAKEVFRREGRLPERRGFEALRFYRTVVRSEHFAGAAGAPTSQGRAWGDFRSKINPPMLQPASTTRYLPGLNEVADDMIDRMRALRDEKSELPAGFINELYKWALESIATVALDTRLGCLAPDLAPDSEAQRMIDAARMSIEMVFELDIKPSLWRYVTTPTWRRFVATMDYFTEVADKHAERAAAAGTRAGREPSILQRLLAEDRRVATVMAGDMLLAGVDTVAHATAGLLFRLAKNPEQQQRLREELARELPPGPRVALTEDALPRMPYLRACLRESLRLVPVGSVNSRTTPRDIVVGGYRIPKGKDMVMCQAVMSRDEQHFPDPDRFEPRRWVRGDELAHSAHPFATLPFGHGPRMCVGRRFAQLEVYTLVSKVIRNFHVEYHQDEELRTVMKTINVVVSPLKFRLTDLP